MTRRGGLAQKPAPAALRAGGELSASEHKTPGAHSLRVSFRMQFTIYVTGPGRQSTVVQGVLIGASARICLKGRPAGRYSGPARKE